jgi:hypothetical protein
VPFSVCVYVCLSQKSVSSIPTLSLKREREVQTEVKWVAEMDDEENPYGALFWIKSRKKNQLWALSKTFVFRSLEMVRIKSI